MNADRPNFLILFADQLRSDVLGAAGNPIVQTPALDSLAQRGLSFVNAYTPSPVCVPARSSFITGLEPQSGSCFENQNDTSSASTFMDALGAAGYQSRGVGKMHFTPDGGALRGFDARDVGEEFGTAESDDYLAHLGENGFGFVEHPLGLRDEMYYVPQLSPVPERLHHSHWVADKSIDFLNNRDQDQPFLLWSSFIAPHPPFTPPAPWHRRYEPSVMPEPVIPQDSESLLTSYNHLQNRYKYRDGGYDRRINQLIKAYYYASVSYLDSQVARILGHLEHLGLRDSTYVIVTSDHGELLGDYGSYGKRSFLDAAARVPLILAGPGIDAGRSASLASLVDVYPTLLELAGLGHDARDGRSLLRADPERAIFGQYQSGELGLYAVITSEWKYIWSAFDRREYLIDRLHDPQETLNLAYNPRRRQPLIELRARASDHFADLRGHDFDALSGNVPLLLGAPPSVDSMRSMDAIQKDRDAATLVVRGGPWTPEEPVAER